MLSKGVPELSAFVCMPNNCVSCRGLFSKGWRSIGVAFASHRKKRVSRRKALYEHYEHGWCQRHCALFVSVCCWWCTGTIAFCSRCGIHILLRQNGWLWPSCHFTPRNLKSNAWRLLWALNFVFRHGDGDCKKGLFEQTQPKNQRRWVSWSEFSMSMLPRHTLRQLRQSEKENERKKKTKQNQSYKCCLSDPPPSDWRRGVGLQWCALVVSHANEFTNLAVCAILAAIGFGNGLGFGLKFGDGDGNLNLLPLPCCMFLEQNNASGHKIIKPRA